MSWRDILGGDAPARPHNLHNPHNCTSTRSSGDCEDNEAKEAILVGAFTLAYRDLPIDPGRVRSALDPADVADWHQGRLSTDAFVAFAKSLAQRDQIEQGVVPPHYREQAVCTHCGPVWLWFSGEVDGCPWCRNRLAGRPIPRPAREDG